MKQEDTYKITDRGRLVADMVRRYNKWNARGTPSPIIMNKILVNIEPIVARMVAEEIFGEIEKRIWKSSYIAPINKPRVMNGLQALKEKYIK